MHGSVEFDSVNAQKYADMGRERLGAGDTGNAVSMFRAALEADPNCFDAILNLGVTIGRDSQWQTGAMMMRRAIAIKPDACAAWANLGLYLRAMQKYDEADEALTRAVELDPKDFATRHNLGLLRYDQNRGREAVEELSHAVELYDLSGQSSRNCRSDLSLATMKAGHLHDGLVMNEVRWHGMLPKLPIWHCGLPRWLGAPALDGKTLLVHSEQGFGDAIQWARFIPLLKAKYSDLKIIFAVPKPLVRLLTGQLDCNEVIDFVDTCDVVAATRKADYHAPLLSLVRILGQEFDDQPTLAPPYLKPVPSRGRPLTVLGSGLRVGLVWAASLGYQRSRERSIPIEDILELAEVPGVRLYSLQFGSFSGDVRKIGAEYIITDLVDQIEDFADTVELAKQLDLVISVDTGPLHVVAATGVPTWLVQPVSTCWRWYRGAKAWYGGVEEYYQERPGDWSAPIGEMKHDLARLVNGR